MRESQRGDASPPIDWEAFYGNYRKPGYVRGYEILTKLGGGLAGIVFKARKQSIGKDYAIKFLKVDDESARDAILCELDTLRFFALVDHPNLVAIEDKGWVDGIPYIVMSYAGDETLRHRLDAVKAERGAGGKGVPGGLPRDEALRIFTQVARGVQALHDHSLVHFDLKPANIFLKGDIARVGDYGLSKLVTQSRRSLSFGRGTPYYLAPEMLRRQGDARSDVYSLGILLHELSIGDVPFKGDTEWEVLRRHEADRLVVPPSVGQPERAVIERCLEKDPDARFASVADLLAALQESSVGRPPALAPEFARDPALAPATATITAIRLRPPLPARPRRRWSFAAVAALLLFGTVLVYGASGSLVHDRWRQAEMRTRATLLEAPARRTATAADALASITAQQIRQQIERVLGSLRSAATLARRRGATEYVGTLDAAVQALESVRVERLLQSGSSYLVQLQEMLDRIGSQLEVLFHSGPAVRAQSEPLLVPVPQPAPAPPAAVVPPSPPTVRVRRS